jgi:hypothetical protein
LEEEAVQLAVNASQMGSPPQSLPHSTRSQQPLAQMSSVVSHVWFELGHV